MARLSLGMLFDEHQRPSDSPENSDQSPKSALQDFFDRQKSPPNSPDVIRHSAEVTGGEPAESEANRATQMAIATAPRPKARPPTLGSVAQTVTPDAAGFERMAEGLGQQAKVPPQGKHGTTTAD